MKDKKMYWYNFLFCSSNGSMESALVGFETEGITKPRISHQKSLLSMKGDIFFQGVSYLGCMTKVDFIGDEDEDKKLKDGMISLD